MTGEYRLAQKEDRPDFLRLWMEFLEEGAAQGSHLLADDHNLGLFRQYFDAYVSGERRGVAAFWRLEVDAANEAVVLAGEQFGVSNWHLDTPEFATLWGIYVAQDHRGEKRGLELEKFGIKYLRRMGFRGAHTSVRTNNPHGQSDWRKWDKLINVEVTEVFLQGLFDPLGDE
jgi:GNAT superfamily N-acetyltransferase